MSIRNKGGAKPLSRFTVLTTSILVLVFPIIAISPAYASPTMTNYGNIGCPGAENGSVTNEITAGPDGASWFTINGGANSYVGRLTTSGGLTCYQLSNDYANPTGITTGPDGALWIAVSTGSNNSGGIYRLTTSGELTKFPFYQGSGRPFAITTGSDGALWFTFPGTNNLYRISTSGDITFNPLPSNTYPGSITTGSDGALWFTEYANNAIGRIDTSGNITEYHPASFSIHDAEGITSGPDGNLWFTNYINGIGKVNLVVTVPAAPNNLTIPSPTQNPSLSWASVQGADSYNIYRNGANIGSTTNTSYTDTTAHEGTDTYAVTAVNSAGESGQSNSVSVLVDRTAPTITYSVSPTPNSAGWNNTPATVTFTCSDNSGGSGIASCSPPQTESTDDTYGLSGSAVDNAGNSASVS